MNEIAYIKIITILVFLIVSIGLYAQEPVNQLDSTNLIAVSNDSIGIDSMFLSPLNHFIPIDSLINYSKKFIGTPYRYGGRSEKGFDCSGFVYYVFKNFGLELPPSSRSQVNVGLPVAKDSMQIGDLIFFKGRNIKSTQIGHVAIVIGVSDTNDVQMIHSTRHGLKVDWLSEELYFRNRFLTTRRLEEIAR